jgi:hypothetical protein
MNSKIVKFHFAMDMVSLNFSFINHCTWKTSLIMHNTKHVPYYSSQRNIQTLIKRMLLSGSDGHSLINIVKSFNLNPNELYKRFLMNCMLDESKMNLNSLTWPKTKIFTIKPACNRQLLYTLWKQTGFNCINNFKHKD